MAFDLICFTQVKANFKAASSLSFNSPLTAFILSLKTILSLSLIKNSSPTDFINLDFLISSFHFNILKFVFFFKSSSACLSKSGAIIISINFLDRKLAIFASHGVFKATIPPKADKGSQLHAFSNAEQISSPIAIAQGVTCLNIAQAGF